MTKGEIKQIILVINEIIEALYQTDTVSVSTLMNIESARDKLEDTLEKNERTRKKCD